MAEQVVARHRPQVALPADDRLVIRVHVKRRRVHLFEQLIGRIVLHAFALRDDDRALGIDFGRIERRLAHQVGQNIQRQRNALARQRKQVAGIVQVGQPVVVAAVFRGEHVNHAFAEARRALEHHVLDPVASAGNARRLVAPADTIERPRRRHRRGMLLLQQHRQAVREGVIGDFIH